MIQPFRIEPKLGPQHYKTYQLAAPLASHWRVGTCAEYECDAYLFGWVTTVDITTELGQRQYAYITHDRTRTCTEEKIGDALIEFTYGPGHACFSQHEHRVPVGRPPLMLVRGGDWRGNPRGTPTVSHRSIEDWMDDCSTHQARLKSAAER